MGPALSGLVRNALGSLAVLATVAAMAFGFPLIDEALPAQRAMAVGVAYQVGGKVSIVPPAGSTIDLTRTRPDDNKGMAMFVVGGIRIGVLVGRYHGTLPRAADRLHDKITNTTGFQVTSPNQLVLTGQGVAGMRGVYSSPGRLGEYAVFVSRNVSVEVTISGPEQRLRALASQINASLQSVTFGAPG